MRGTLIAACTMCMASCTLGCFTVAGNQLKDISPAAAPVRPAIDQTVGDFTFDLDGEQTVASSDRVGREINDWILDRWERKEFIDGHTYVQSFYLPHASDYQLTLSGYQRGKSSIELAVISGLTLTLVPMEVNTELKLEYTLVNVKTGCEFSADASDSFRQVVGLLLLPLAPFWKGGRETTLDRLSDSLYAGLVADGAFDQRTRCEPMAGTNEPQNPHPSTPQRQLQQLRELEVLRSRGEVSEAEYERQKNEWLDSP